MIYRYGCGIIVETEETLEECFIRMGLIKFFGLDEEGEPEW